MGFLPPVAPPPPVDDDVVPVMGDITEREYKREQADAARTWTGRALTLEEFKDKLEIAKQPYGWMTKVHNKLQVAYFKSCRRYLGGNKGNVPFEWSEQLLRLDKKIQQRRCSASVLDDLEWLAREAAAYAFRNAKMRVEILGHGRWRFGYHARVSRRDHEYYAETAFTDAAG